VDAGGLWCCHWAGEGGGAWEEAIGRDAVDVAGIMDVVVGVGVDGGPCDRWW